MRSTGGVMGVDSTLGAAFDTALKMAGTKLPLSGETLVTVNARDYAEVAPMVARLLTLGFSV